MGTKQTKRALYLSTRLSIEEQTMLDEICEYHLRKKSDMARYLIIIEHRRITEIKRLRGELEDEINENN